MTRRYYEYPAGSGDRMSVGAVAKIVGVCHKPLKDYLYSGMTITQAVAATLSGTSDDTMSLCNRMLRTPLIKRDEDDPD
jgi:hypothetical protein